MAIEKHKWYIDYTSPATAHIYGIDNYIKSYKTDYQQVEIADTDLFGRILVLDGKVQSAETDEYIYHEALVHPPMLMSPAPKRVLVAGGGEGATLREILKHPDLEELVMVDLDRQVVELCKEYLTSWHRGSFDDKRVKLHFMDARKYIEEGKEPFDVIISDIPEPVEEGPALKLFTIQFYETLKKSLNPGGVLALQAGDTSRPFIETYSALNKTIRQVMPLVCPYRAFVPSFNTEWGFILASPEERSLPEPETIDNLIKTRNLGLRFFDGETYTGMFNLPKDIRKILSEETRIIDDSNLITIY
ncbi:MAG: polyamine aminopropyltransferase [Bacillota bacterium]